MRRTFFDGPNTVTSSPMLSILPSTGSVKELDKYSTSFFARLEKVEALGKSVSSDDQETLLRLSREADMLREVLAWISDDSGGVS